MRGLRTRAGADFAVDGDGELHVSVSGLNVLAQTSEDIFILHEIFVYRVYRSPGSTGRPWSWDIGGNVGFASLYFAQQSSVRPSSR